MRELERFREALRNANVVAFLQVIRACEGTADPDGYRRMFGGELFDSFADHPRRAITRNLGGRPLTSTAAGAYQFLARTWDECRDALGLPDFSQTSQDLGAVFLIARRGALDLVKQGRLEAALAACAREWASLPGSPYGQPTKTMAFCRLVYLRAGGQIEADQTPTPEPAPAPTNAPPAPQPEPTPNNGGKTMPAPVVAAVAKPFLIAAATELLKHIPKLARLWSSGSEVSERNIKAAEIVVDIAKKAVGANNEQELVERMNDPQAVAVVREAVDANWFRIDEVGGGIAAARAFNVASSTGDPRRNLALWITIALLPLLYMTVAAVLFGSGWSDDVRAMVVAAIVSGLLGAMTGYWLGTSFSSARKDERAATAAAQVAP